MEMSIFRKRNFILLILGRLLSVLGITLLNFLLALYVLKTTGSGTKFASVLALSASVYLVVTPISGVFTDWLDRKKIMVLSDCLSGVAVLLLWLSAGDNGGIAINNIYLLVIVLAFCGATDTPAVSTAIPTIVSEDELMSANSVSSISETLGQIIAPILGGIAYGALSLNGILLIVGSLFCFAAIIELFLKLPKGEKTLSKHWLKEFKLDFEEGFQFIRSSPVILGTLLISIIINLLLAPMSQVGVPFLIKIDLAFSDIQFSFIEALFVIGMLVGSLVAPAFQRYKLTEVLKVTLCLIGVILAIMSVTVWPSTLSSSINRWILFGMDGFFIFMIGTMIAVISITVQTLLQKTTPQGMLGRVYGISSMIAMALMPIGQLTFGIVFDSIASWLILLIVAILVVITSLSVTAFYRKQS